MSHFSFLFLLIWMLSLRPLLSVDKGLSTLLIFCQNQLLVMLIPCSVLFLFTWLISALSLMISCHLLPLSILASFCSIAFRCAVKLLVYSLCYFFFEALRPINFPLYCFHCVSSVWVCCAFIFIEF